MMKRQTRRAAGRGIAVPYLASWRGKRLFSQLELAEKAGLSTRTVSRTESGYNADFTTIKAIAAALGISAEELVEVNPLATIPTATMTGPQ